MQAGRRGGSVLALGWDLWVLGQITVVWQVVGEGAPSSPRPLLSLSPCRGLARPRGSGSVLQWAGSLLPGPSSSAWAGVGLGVSSGPVASVFQLLSYSWADVPPPAPKRGHSGNFGIERGHCLHLAPLFPHRGFITGHKVSC